jgi:hypothetical protein
MAAAADCDLKRVTACESESGDDIAYTFASCNSRWILIYHAIPDATTLAVIWVTGSAEVAL